MATAGFSSFGTPIVVREEAGPLPPLRLAFTIITVILGLCALVHASLYLLFLRRVRGGARRGPVLAVFAAYAAHLVVHTAHFADNIARPVDYFEPWWLYRGYVLSTMEITFFANWPMVISGAVLIGPLLKSLYRRLHGVDGDGGRASKVSSVARRRRLCWGVVAYASTSIMTLMHYVVEPPVSYAPVVNFTIAGEGVAALVLGLVVAFNMPSMSSSSSLEGDVKQQNETELETLAGEEHDHDDGTKSQTTISIDGARWVVAAMP
ncbi:uncharacterized protein ACA1_219810 [Acanthamoeba castellanii str. Neff]|uniref:Uncharacterized protein n=1 Tax=Acanthamoeba castellanii (strain ATCC 30010 / Neff) TaxID=1257118 RepID=L8GQI7_ACACF|nr:uncharacterized protein ACA1_219810 [Acanthamoeba castellanii str. Neff]ELR15255.1 hypothetical protein ACA1_219810 [Acanthamoeba castellanii str. Neff]